MALDINTKKLKKNAFRVSKVRGIGASRIRVPGGYLDARVLGMVQEIAQTYGNGYVHLTTRQGFEIEGIRFEDMAEINEKLQPIIDLVGTNQVNPNTGYPASGTRNISACIGNNVCPFANYNTAELARKIEKAVFPHDLHFKIACTGCSNDCAKARMHDFGIIGQTMPQYDPTRCVSCKACIKGCKSLSVNALRMENYKIVRDENKCVGCGVCVTKCPTRAWTRSKKKYYKLAIMGRTGKKNPRLGQDWLIWADEENIINQTPFRIGETVAEALGARAIAANDIYEMRTGKRQKIEIDINAASATCLGGTDMTMRKNAAGEYEPIPKSPEFTRMESITQPWETKDGKWFLPHFNLPHLEKKVCDLLGCTPDPESVAEAVKKWDADKLDQAIADAHATGGILYTEEEWLRHPHGQYLASVPVVEIKKIGDSAPEPLSALAEGTQPLSGLRVLDLTRILAGPTCGISLAEHGADVLMVTAPELPQVPAFVRDTSHGKRSCYLDYKIPEQAAKLRELAKDADVFVQGYRPGRMKANGFGVEELAKLRPGIIYVSVDCFGSGGPLSDRAGWDQVAQAVTGMCFTQGDAANGGRPQLAPVFVCDFLTGFLGAYGAMLALVKRAKEGGSYHVHVSLCQSAMLIQRQGLREDFAGAADSLTKEKFEQFAVCDDGTVYGDLKSLGPVIRMSETSPAWVRTTPELGSGKPEWL